MVFCDECGGAVDASSSVFSADFLLSRSVIHPVRTSLLQPKVQTTTNLRTVACHASLSQPPNLPLSLPLKPADAAMSVHLSLANPSVRLPLLVMAKSLIDRSLDR